MVLRCVAEGAIGVRLAGPSAQPDKFPPCTPEHFCFLKTERNRPDTGMGETNKQYQNNNVSARDLDVATRTLLDRAGVASPGPLGLQHSRLESLRKLSPHKRRRWSVEGMAVRTQTHPPSQAKHPSNKKQTPSQQTITKAPFPIQHSQQNQPASSQPQTAPTPNILMLIHTLHKQGQHSSKQHSDILTSK